MDGIKLSAIVTLLKVKKSNNEGVVQVHIFAGITTSIENRLKPIPINIIGCVMNGHGKKL